MSTTPDPPKTVPCTNCQDNDAPISTGKCIKCALTGGIFSQAETKDPFNTERNKQR